MDILQTLPAELRQHILSFTLPGECAWGKTLPRDVLNLVQISHSLRLDMAVALKQWSPIHYVAHAKDITDAAGPKTVYINGLACGPKYERLCLDLFHEAEIDCIEEMTFQWPWCTHRNMVLQWVDVIPHLPESLSEIYLDLTPVPPAVRSRHRLILNHRVWDRRVECFTARFATDVARVARSIHTNYAGRISIFGTGTLSVKSNSIFEKFRQEFGVDLEFLGIRVTKEEGRIAKILPATNTKNNPALRRLYYRKWSKSTHWSYAQVGDEYGEDAAWNDMRAIAEFSLDVQRTMLVMESTGNARRALQHRVAADLSLETESEGVGEQRHVVIKRPIEKPKEIATAGCAAKPISNRDIEVNGSKGIKQRFERWFHSGLSF